MARNSPGVVQRERRFWRTSQSMTTGCCWPLLPVRPLRDGAFFVRSPAGVNGATLQENAPEASCRVVFRCDGLAYFFSPAAQLRTTVRARTLPRWPRNLWSSGSASRPPYIVGKEGESRDSWRRRLPSFCLRTLRARKRASGLSWRPHYQHPCRRESRKQHVCGLRSDFGFLPTMVTKSPGQSTRT